MTTQISTQNPLPEVSVDAMEDSSRKIRDAYAELGETQYEDFKRICNNINQDVIDTLDLAKSTIIETKALLNNTASIEAVNEFIHAKEEELAAATDPEEQAKIQEDIEKFRERGEPQITEKLDPIDDKASSLNYKVGEIELSDFKFLVDEEIGEINQELNETINPNIAKYEQLIKETQEDYDEISELMHIMEEEGFLDFVSDTIPTPREIEAILKGGKANPYYAAIIAGLQVCTELIDEIGDGFSYVQLQETRNFLWEQLQNYQNELRSWEEKKRNVEVGLNDLTSINFIESERFVFTAQVKNLAEAYTTFTQEIRNLLETEVNYDKILQYMADTVVYLDSVF
ncbi:MAG: alpha-xenorhabdolysin family binary toxin subunit B [Okeania sp. SIO3I5]|uniref:alpha-xenorhabdolysin family binary toxin subunit B n=1 Tax=Okeania sp. SIO3I5 TaxID=2607805 RepID=UPI0013B7AD9E|nr:alpha-xenorhabdolysin family binary toxin subunit B [Okeania sp. SIO3I5]NEQ35708.1 alpha-xenorhabdolysin family binary toxin subunit B [Okeania sp. SIO3I5]